MLPEEKTGDFADSLLKKHEEEILTKGLEKLVEQSKTFDFLNDEDDLYTDEDITDVY